ncbi:helix-turn-helix domain-containing protein [Loktanella sp. IMCC34160]|uniref:helix-turn-helix domain-containing protein n=1 Tax=Loktanella sp. IMCC34160 TaxID=2510646 RepID=UPI0013EDD98F|nr:helix-turn-helix domain-containing protein [Loktanella sp. IMCC34160]
MKRSRKSIDDIVPFSDSVDLTRVPLANSFLIERHKPALFDTPFHHHTSVEINYLQGCSMDYSFSGATAELRPDRIVVFWGALPHTVTRVSGDGRITNIYLSLGQFVRWGLPSHMVKAVLSGDVICSTGQDAMDALLMDRIYRERERSDPSWRRMHLAELDSRLRRLALEGWTTLLAAPRNDVDFKARSQEMRHVENMLSFISENFSIPISVDDIAAAANLSPARAGQIFRKIMTVGIKKHLTRTRMSHARMLLIETEAKISAVALDSGFASLSAFYEAFVKENGVAPAKFRSQSHRSNPFHAFRAQP